jgi:hypothetical protein
MAVSMIEQTAAASQLGGPPVSYDPELERIEIELLLEGIFRRYGFDFRAYAHASLRRRLWKRVEAERLTTISALQARVLHDSEALDRMLLGQRHGDVSRSRFLQGIPRDRRAAPPYLSIHPRLARGMFDGRRGVLDGDPAPRRRTARSRAHLCDGHQ